MCAAGTHIFENAAKILDLNKCVLLIKNYYATTSYKHVKKRWKVSFKTRECIEVQGRNFEKL